MHLRNGDKMLSESIEIWNITKEIIKDIALYIMPIAAVLVSVIALIKSNKCTQVQLKLSEMEKKLQEYDLALKKYELEKIEREMNQERKACVEARIIKISQGNYKLKVWNSGDATAYNIDVEIPSEYNIILMKDKLPFEYLKPSNGFDEHVVVHMQSSRKFKIICKWEDENGGQYFNEQIRDC